VTTVADRVAAIVAPAVAALGLDLYDIEHNGASLRVLVDREGGVDLEAITRATRALSRALDEADPIEGHYTLEVSSPGLERPLRRPDHFAAAARAHETVRIKTKPGTEGERRIEGTLDEVGDDTVTVRLPDGSTRTVRLDEIERARTTFDWGPAPRPGRPTPEQQETTR
jgi:ribosome maturation factor RimP